jgi:hypothetical protein
MFPWLTNPTSLRQMYQANPPQQGGFFSRACATRRGNLSGNIDLLSRYQLFHAVGF